MTPPAGVFDFQEPASKSLVTARRRKRPPLWQSAGLWIGGLAVVGAIGYGGWKASQRTGSQAALALRPPGDQRVSEEAALALRVAVSGEGVAISDLQFVLVDPPAGATIDASTGEFFWTPSEDQGPGDYRITVRVETTGTPVVADEKTFTITVAEVAQPPEVEPIEDQIIDSASPFSLDVIAEDHDLPASTLSYSLETGAPPGATIDASTGRFNWKPGEIGPGSYPVTIRVAKVDDPDLAETVTFELEIAAPAGPQRLIDQLAADLRREGLLVTSRGREPLPGLGGAPQVLAVDDAEITLLAFETEEEALSAAAKIPADASILFGEAGADAGSLRVYRKEELLVFYQGDDASILGCLAAGFGSPFSSIAATAPQSAPPTPEDVATLKDLLEKKQLFNVKQYPQIRKIFADRFEQQFDTEIRVAFGSDYEETQAWFAERPNLKQELFIAIDPQFDDVEGALRLFKELKEAWPKQIDSYGELAIAVSVVWDRERGSIYEYGHHARRTQSNYGGELLDGPGNFRFFVETEPLMQGRVQFLPREFLVHVVNHRTPTAERIWALKGYGGRRAMYGQCYSDVPYDDRMLETDDRVCRLNDKDYILPNILQHGGVCSMQADFAARVGKSIGIPAAYVSGESIYGEAHAWVMWVELKSVTRAGIAFSLESHGRYRGDKYYVGDLRDPQTGRKMTDRDLELKLHNAGSGALAARQADLLVRAYPLLREAAEMTRTDRIEFLNNVITLSPGNEAAWKALAEIPGEGPLDKPDERLMLASFDRLFRTFANFPDFTWKVFGDLVRFVEEPRQRVQFYERLVVLYEAAGRPDLACEARLALTDLLVEEERTADAIGGLAYTIRKFPDEGRYVPRMLDRLETICADFPELNERLVRFYVDFLPAIPRTRGSRPSEYCQEMYERAIALFRANNQPQLVATLTAELAKMQGSRGR